MAWKDPEKRRKWNREYNQRRRVMRGLSKHGLWDPVTQMFWRYGFNPDNLAEKLKGHIITWLGELGLLDGDGPEGFNPEHIHNGTVHNRRSRGLQSNATLFPENWESESWLAVKWVLNHKKLFGRGKKSSGDMGLMFKTVWPEVFDCVKPHLIPLRKGGRLDRALWGWRTQQGGVRARTLHLALKDVWGEILEIYGENVTNEDIFEFVEFTMMASMSKSRAARTPYSNLLGRGYGARIRSGGNWKIHRALLSGVVSRDLIKRFKDRRADGTFGPSTYSYAGFLWWKNKHRVHRGSNSYWKGELWDIETCKALLIKVMQDLLPTLDIPDDFDPYTAEGEVLNEIHYITSDNLRDYPVIGSGVNRRLRISVNPDGSTKEKVSSHHLGHYLNHPETWPNPVAKKRTPWDMSKFGGQTHTNERAMNRYGYTYLGHVDDDDGIFAHSYDRHKPTRVTVQDVLRDYLLGYPDSEHEGLSGGSIRPDHIIVNASWYGYDLILQMHGSIHWKGSRKPWGAPLKEIQNRDAYQWHFVWPNQEGHGLAIIPTWKYVTTVTKELFGETITMYEGLMESGRPQWNWRLETEERDVVGQAGLCNLLELQDHPLYANHFRIKRAHGDMSNDEASVVSLLMQDHSMEESVDIMGNKTMEEWREEYQ